MNYRKTGKWGLRLSELGFGCWLNIGGTCDDETSVRLIRAAYDRGINFFDTANVYGRCDTVSRHGTGQAERLLARALRGRDRSSYVLLTKVNARIGPGPNDEGLSAKHVFEQCHASLKRLETDYIDIYMCHRPDPTVPLEETVRVFEDLARQGKTLYWGVSEWSPAQVLSAQAVARALSARPIAVNEPRYNLLYRFPEHDIFPVTRQEGIGNVVFSPLAHGMLTGKYLPGEPAPPGSRGADDTLNAFMKRLYWTEDNKRRGQRLAALAAELGLKASQLALAWVLHNRDVTSAILGVRRDEQLEENLRATENPLPDDVVAQIEAMYPDPGHPAPRTSRGGEPTLVPPADPDT